MNRLVPNCMATAVGSMPHEDPARALDVIFASIPEAPIWPQLPARGIQERMEVQYAEGMPRCVIDREKDRMYFDTTGDYSEDLAAFYERYLLAMDPDDGTGDCSDAEISPRFAAGLQALISYLEARQLRPPFLKVHTTGPVSFTLTITDESKRALYYNEEFRDMITKALAMKCRWQIQRFRPHAAEGIICFIDEPILSAFGSSTYVSVARDDVIAMLAEVIEAVHAEGALAGIHCCGNTEWSIPIEAGADIINFDAFEFGETIAMYPEQVAAHLKRGGLLAWGVVPTSPAVNDQTAESLADRYDTLIKHLAARTGVDVKTIIAQTLITGSCGTGSLPVDTAETAFRLKGALSSILRARYGLLSHITGESSPAHSINN